jgi:exopolysaccharide production protein ExoQ
MPPFIATIVFTIGILGLFLLDRDRETRTSKALSIPIIWVILVISRPVSEWLQGVSADRPIVELDVDPLQRSLFAGLWVIGVLVLLGRRRRVLALLRENGPILLFFSYCTVSLLWSDYPGVAFTRLIKAFGDLAMVMIVLTDPERSLAFKKFLARAAFLLVPVSVLLIKYYPERAVGYKQGDGKKVFTGVTTNKNLLGVILLLFGLAAVWRVFHGLRDRQHAQSNRPLIAQGVILAMIFWLFWRANSMTALASFMLAGGLMVATNFSWLARKRVVVHFLVAIVLMVASTALFFDAGGAMLQAVGRDPSLTGRTELWQDVLSLSGNPLFGTGFESFWQGTRLHWLWSKYWWHPNEAHNGYLEVYLNLGWIGITLLALLILLGYRNIIGMLRRDPDASRIRLAYFVVAVIYSFTEAGFRLMNPIWIFFLLATAAVPESSVPKGSDTSPEETLPPYYTDVRPAKARVYAKIG